jgi:Tol biopolymer transport system component
MGKLVRAAALAIGFGAAVAVFAPGTAVAATPTFTKLIAYVRGGNIYVSKGATEVKLTKDGKNSRPRFAPDGKRLAFLREGRLWVMKADGTGQTRLTTGPASGPAWAPDGASIGYAAIGCTGGPAIYRIPAAGGTPTVLFPAECRTEALPATGSAVPTAPTGTLAERLRRDDAVAWSPDGTQVAFRDGMCAATYDDCLTLGTVATGAEKTLAGFGGGGADYSGFAVVPAFSPDGKKLTWTAYREGSQPVHVVERDLAGTTVRTIGSAEDREMVYTKDGRGLVTGVYQGGSWVIVVNLATGARTPFHAGSQPSIQP